MVKKYFVHPNHAFKRISTGDFKSLDHAKISGVADEYYKDNFFVNDFSFVLVSRLGDPKDPISIADSKKKIFDQLRRDLSEKTSKIRKYNPTPRTTDFLLPFMNAPALIAVPAKTLDSVLLKFQVGTTFEQENKYESMHFIKFALNKLLRAKLHEENLFGKTEGKVYYHSSFAILNVEVHLSHQGKLHSGRVIGAVLSAIKYIESRSETKLQELYERFKKELHIIYHTKGILSARMITETLCSKLPKFGLMNAFSATEVLNRFNGPLIRQLAADLLKPENMIIVISGDFAESESRSIEPLQSLLNSRIMSYFNLQESRKIPGSIKLDQKDDTIPYRFHTQNISRDEFNFIMGKASDYVFAGFDNNPYSITFEMFEESMMKKDSSKRGSFNVEKNNVHGSKVVFYRQNTLFPFPMIYANIKLGPDDHNANSANANDLKYTEKMMIIMHLWRHKLRLIQNYLREYNGEAGVFFEHGVLNIHIYAPKQRFQRAFEDVLQAISTNGLGSVDIEEAKERILRELSYSGISFTQANKDVRRMILKYEFTSKAILDNLKHSFFKAGDIDIKLHTVFAFFEGDLDRDLAERCYDILNQRHPM